MATQKTRPIEIIKPNFSRGKVKFALFDFDGTLSLIRAGWQDVMVNMMVGLLKQAPNHEDDARLKLIVREYIDNLTGHQTIYQMIRLGEEIEKRGGIPQDPLVYKHMYLGRLDLFIQDRKTGLKSGKFALEDMMVSGAEEMLEQLVKLGVHCYLASGTDEVYVLEEASILNLTQFFDGIFGAQDDYKSFSKKLVINKIINKNQINPDELVVFGDGYVEIENTAIIGGIAVGVATNETHRGEVDTWKRQRLIDAGADIIVPDFLSHQQLLSYLFEDV